jgi:CHASE2 domain-containing sensor protein
LQLAAKFLDTEPQESGTAYSLKGVEFPPIAPYTGGYQGIDADGHQLLLNYRSVQGSPRNIAETVTLQNVLSGQVPFQTLKDRIVLIGVTAPDKGDDWPTPYQEEIPGVMIQAQMTSQLLSAVAQERPLLWVWPQAMEALWIVGWSMLGGLLVWRLTRLRWLALAVLGAGGMLFLVCWLSLSWAAGWLPLIPAGLALGTSAIASRIITYTGEKS